jgi:hypothetical protein
MPPVRNRVLRDGGPAPCSVTVRPALAAYLYRELALMGLKSETDLVNVIVADWVRLKGLPPVDWPAVARQLRPGGRGGGPDPNGG